MLRTILIFLITLISITASAQQDSTGRQWSRFTPALRISAGLTPKFYFEPGIALHKYISDPPNSCSHNIYAAMEMTGTTYGDRGFLLLAPKIGYQFQAIFYAIGIETKYLSDGRNKDLVLALKAGFSILGMADLMYGYQVSANQYPFPGVGAHQFSLAFTLYRGGFR